MVATGAPSGSAPVVAVMASLLPPSHATRSCTVASKGMPRASSSALAPPALLLALATFSTLELTKSGPFQVILWAQQHSNNAANPEPAGANGSTSCWKSSKQPQVPRSTAEAECTAMAYCSQMVEGIACLFHTMRVAIGRPTLYCDNRAAVHLTAGSSEWRTQALINQIMGVKSLIELGRVSVLFKPTADMEGDFLTKFMGAKLLTKQRSLAGCVSWSAPDTRSR